LIRKWVWREIKSQPSAAVSLVLTLFLGLLAFNSIDIVRFSIADSLRTQAKVLLAADIALTSRRPLTEAEKKSLESVLDKNDQVQEIWELYTMVRTNKSSRLVQLKALPRDFAFYGQLNLENSDSVVSINESDKVWVHPELVFQLGLKNGDRVKIGDKIFTIANFVTGDFVNSWKGLSLAPKVYMGLERLMATGLVKPGSTVSYNYLIKVADVKSTEKKYEMLNQVLKDPAVKIYDDEKASKEIVRGLAAVSDYLGLVAIVALFLAGIGIHFLFNGYILRKRREIAIYNSLGLSRGRAVIIYSGYLLALGVTSLLPTWAVAYAILPRVNELIRSFMPFAVEPQLPISVLLVSVFVAALSICISGFSVLWRIHEEPPANLFREDRSFPLSSLSGKLLGIISAGVLIWVLSVYQSQSLRVSTFFLLGLGGLLLMLILVGVGFIKFLGKYADWFPLTAKLAVKSLARQPAFSLFGIIAIGAAFFLSLLIPLIREGLVNELRQPPGIVLPNLFMFDIQEEQAPELKKLLAKDQLVGLSPMVRARLVEINGAAFEKAQMPTLTTTREEDTEGRFRNRGVNLSFRGELNEGETVIQGKFGSGISIEKFFMDQLKLKMGDKLLFDVQGVPVEGIITSVRNVRWNSFMPNFFIIFQPGVLEDAPKTFLAAVKGLNNEQIGNVQNLIVDKFPNISVVDVRRTVDRITTIIHTMVNVLELMSYLCVLIGIVIFIAVLFHHGESLVREWQLLSLLGMAKAKVRRGHVLRMTVLGLVAGLVAAISCLAVSRIMLKYVFEVYVIPSETKYIFLGLIFLTGTVISVSYLVYQTLQRQKP
jgi:putative ABC transport system permease protein